MNQDQVAIYVRVSSDQQAEAGITSNPDGQWVAQQARQLVWQFEENDTSFRCLIRDNDSKFTEAFDTVFESQHNP